jgi:serine/threonine protein phosphatase PrpC
MIKKVHKPNKNEMDEFSRTFENHETNNISMNCFGSTIQQRAHEDMNFSFPPDYKKGKDRLKFFIVCDGHGVPKNKSKKIHQLFCFGDDQMGVNKVYFSIHEKITEKMQNFGWDFSKMEKAIFDSFEEIDCVFFENREQRNYLLDGSCVAMIVVLDDRYAYAAHSGDSRIGIWKGDSLIYESKDHNTYDVNECDRIKSLGGFSTNGRFCGILAVSRSLGDFDIGKADSPVCGGKEKLISPIPHVEFLDMGNDKTETYRALLTSDAPFEYSNHTVKSLMAGIDAEIKHYGLSYLTVKRYNKEKVARGTTDDSTIMYVSDLQ